MSYLPKKKGRKNVFFLMKMLLTIKIQTYLFLHF